MLIRGLVLKFIRDMEREKTNLLRKEVKDERVIQLIKRYLKSGVMEEVQVKAERLIFS